MFIIDSRWRRPINQVSIPGDKWCDYDSLALRDSPGPGPRSRFLYSYLTPRASHPFDTMVETRPVGDRLLLDITVIRLFAVHDPPLNPQLSATNVTLPWKWWKVENFRERFPSHNGNMTKSPRSLATVDQLFSRAFILRFQRNGNFNGFHFRDRDGKI